jgi:cytochrome c biogenesis protein ResB
VASGGREAGCRLNENLILIFENKKGEPRAYRSQVSIIENEKVVAQTTIAVNSPFAHGGYEFYQSGWDAKNLDYSGLKVVRDPGLNVVYAGMIMISLGVLFVFYVRQRLKSVQQEQQA